METEKLTKYSNTSSEKMSINYSDDDNPCALLVT